MLKIVSRSHSRRAIFVCVIVGLCCFAQGEKCTKESDSGKRKCGGRYYKLNSELARVAELPVGSTVCRVHWDEIRRLNDRCSAPRASHSRALKKAPIPRRLFSVLDAVGRETENEYRPGTRWCSECASTIDHEEKFTTRPEYVPPGSRTAKQKVISYKSEF